MYEVDSISDSPNPYDAHQFGHPLKTRKADEIHSCSEFNGMSQEEIETKRPTHGRYIGMCFLINNVYKAFDLPFNML